MKRILEGINMGFLGIKSKTERAIEANYSKLQDEVSDLRKKASVSANYDNIIPLGSRVLPFNGEKNLGEMGPIVTWLPQYSQLASRSWQAYLETPLAKTVIDKWTGWIIDTGLKLKANPSRIVLESEGLRMSKEQQEAFNDIVEARWDVWSRSKNSSWTGEDNFAETTKKTYINSKIGGDVLVVLRYSKGCLKIQTFDGMRVQQPFGINPTNDNRISNGVEIDSTGKVVAYWLKDGKNKSYSIPAYSKETGLRVAFLVKGSAWRLDYHRGLPVITTVLESMKKIERYQEATVASAEEVAKIAYQVVHQNFSDGSSPLQQQLAKSAGFDDGKEPVDILGEKLASRIAATTNKQAYNNPKGAKIETVNQSNNLTGSGEFYTSNAHIVCSAVGIPPNVAMSIYNDSFSASRAATKDWDHSMDVEREFFTAQYYVYVYKYWLYMEILSGKIQAPGYLKAFEAENFMVTESYEVARFTGPHFPHINPLTEVQAERAKLGELGTEVPLTTVEQATEVLGGGDSDSNAAQFADELKNFTELTAIFTPKE